MTPEEMQARILYRDGLMLVIDKPAGLPVHRGPKGGASLDDFFDALRFGLPRPPALAHRLDKETSGCLVLGRHRKALAHLGLLFKHGKVGKTYWAVVEGGPDAAEGVIELPLGRLDATRGWWMKPDPKGLPAVTTWRVLGHGMSGANDKSERVGAHGDMVSNVGVPEHSRHPPPPLRGRVGEGGEFAVPESDSIRHYPPPGPLRGPTSPSRGEVCGQTGALGEVDNGNAATRMSEVKPNLTWLALEPLTGRTHQLRVHCAAMGWPILGDNIYGSGPRFGGPGLHLHAREIVIPLTKNREPVRVIAPIPAHMRDALRVCGFSDE
jgi:tRNA pseudouridine32 synthase/23S rRNA pseudouridine746 synthase